LSMPMNDHQSHMMDLIQKASARKGWKIISNQYGNLRKPKVKLECSRGHKFELAPRSLIDEHPVCHECRNLDFQVGRFTEIRELAHSLGYECISGISEFKNERSRLRFRCQLGHEWTWQARVVFKQSSCPECSQIKHDQEMLQPFLAKIQEQGGKLVSCGYLGSRATHEIECGQGHRFLNSPSNILRGQWCQHCKGLAPKSIEEIRKFAESLGWKLLSNEYINNRSNLTWQCDQGHIFKARWANVQIRKRCPVCNELRPYSIDEMRQIARDHGGECLSEE